MLFIYVGHLWANINIIITQNMKYYKCILTIFCLTLNAILSGIFIILQSFLIFISVVLVVASCLLLNSKIEPTNKTHKKLTSIPTFVIYDTFYLRYKIYYILPGFINEDVLLKFSLVCLVVFFWGKGLCLNLFNAVVWWSGYYLYLFFMIQ